MRINIDGTDITDYIKLNGVKWSRNDVDGPNAGRNLSGTMIRDRIATKIRLDVSCRPLTDTEHRTLLNLLLPESVTVNYEDPMLGTISKVMYANNHNSEYLFGDEKGAEWWHNVSFPLIEI